MRAHCSHSFPTDASGQLDVFWHNGDTFRVDGAQIGVFEKANEVRFRGFVQSKDSGALEAQVRFEVLGDLPYEALERQLPDQQVGGLLVPADLPKGDRARSVAMRFLHTASRWLRFARGFGCQLFARRLATSGFPRSLLCAGHSVC